MKYIMKIALIAHDKKKEDIARLSIKYKDVLANHNIYPLEYIKKCQNQFIKRKFFVSENYIEGDMVDELLEYLEKNYKRTYDDIKKSGAVKNI